MRWIPRSSAPTGRRTPRYQLTPASSLLARNSDDADREFGRATAITSQTLRFHKQSTLPLEVRGEELLQSVLLIQHGRLLNSKVEHVLEVPREQNEH